MNRLLEELAEACETHRLEEKVFIAPSRAIGHQVAEALVRAGHHWINLHIETLQTLACNIVSADLAEAGLKPVSRAQALALIELACVEALEENGYYGKLRTSQGFHRVMRATLEDLRRAEVWGNDLEATLFEDPRKGKDLRAILESYHAALARNSLVDQAEILRRAHQKAKRTEGPLQAIYLVPDRLDLSSSEREFLESMAEGRLSVLATDDPSGWKRSPASVEMFCALGEENEVREIFRRILAGCVELDRVEALYTDGATYVPIIYELSAQYDLPCTYAEGIPIVFSRPARAALSLLEWIAGDYDAGLLRRMIEGDLLDLTPFFGRGELTGSVGAARVLRDAGIGWGRDRYVPCLDGLIQAYRERGEKSEGDSDSGEQRPFYRRQVTVAMGVRSLVEELLAIASDLRSDEKTALGEIAETVRVFVQRFCRIGSRFDGMASAALSSLFDELSVLPETQVSLREAARRLGEAIRGIAVDASTPKPGHLHVGDCRTGGYSGREVIFILGVDESRYPGSGLQDPLLLDSERRDINRSIQPRCLPLLGERPKENRDSLHALLSRLRGQVIISYSCRDLLEDREQFPPPILLEIYRSVSDMPQADYRALRSALGEAAGFIPADSVYLDETEWWLQQLRESKKGNDIHLARVRNAYPWLDRGWNAARERSSDRFTVFDGWLKDVEGELDPRQNRQPVSCTQIESLARCPFAYFLRYVLEIEPPEDWARDPTLWLDARTFGSLLHEVFRAFMVDLTGREEKPNFQLHWNLLKFHAEEAIERWRSQLPPPNMAAYTRQQNHVLVACETFLKNEETHCREVMPQYFEVPFGLSEDAPVAPMGSRSPVSIDMGEGKDFLLRGCIDRIDWRRDGEYEVWDYKSGSPRAFHQQKPLNRGRQIQHTLYARAVEILLARAEKQGRVIRSGYFFPGPRGAGERMALEHDATALKKVIDALFTLLGGGVFPFAPDSDSCGWCDYEVVCGGAKDANVRTTAKLNNPATSNAVLDPLRRLIDCDD